MALEGGPNGEKGPVADASDVPQNGPQDAPEKAPLGAISNETGSKDIELGDKALKVDDTAQNGSAAAMVEEDPPPDGGYVSFGQHFAA